MPSRRLLTTLCILTVLCAIGYAAFAAIVQSTTEAALKRARQHLQRGDTERVRAELQWPLWFNRRHPAALQLTGLSYLRQKKWPAAIESLERIPEHSSLFAESQISLAGALLADRQFERTESVLRRSLKDDPGSMMANRLLSGLYLTELRRHDAIDVLEQAVQHQANSNAPQEDVLLILRDLATAEFHPPLAAECLPTLKEALERDPGQATVRLAVGQCLWDAGALSEAEPFLREALQHRPNDLRIRFVVTEFLLEAADTDAAAAVLLGNSNLPTNVNFQSELEQQPRYWTLKSRIAELHGDFSQALIDLERAAALRHEDKEELARRGRLRQRLNQSEAARDALARSHESARAELDLWNLSREVGTRMPSLKECETMAEHYGTLGKPHQSAAWSRLAQQIRQ